MVTLVVDTSAVVACLTDEPERAAFIKTMALAERRVISSVNLLEARIVLVLSKRVPIEMLDSFMTNERIDVLPFDVALSDLAFDAYRRFGKGRNAARLNMGDCAAYALAKARGWPLLYKGNDFALTDVERA